MSPWGQSCSPWCCRTPSIEAAVAIAAGATTKGCAVHDDAALHGAAADVRAPYDKLRPQKCLAYSPNSKRDTAEALAASIGVTHAPDGVVVEQLPALQRSLASHLSDVAAEAALAAPARRAAQRVVPSRRRRGAQRSRPARHLCSATQLSAADCRATCALFRALCESVLLSCSEFVLLSCSNSLSWPRWSRCRVSVVQAHGAQV